MRRLVASIARHLFPALILSAITWIPASAIAYSSHTIYQDQWSLLSIPADPGPDGSLENLFGDDLPVNEYGPSGQWVVYSFSDTSPRFRVIPIDEPLQKNTGYWFFQSVASSIELDIPDSLKPVEGTAITGCAQGSTCTATQLAESNGAVAWTLVGYSSDNAIRFGDTAFVSAEGACANGCTPDEAAAANMVSNIMLRLVTTPDGARYEQVRSDTQLRAWDAYWMISLPAANSLQWVVPMGDANPDPDPDPDPDPVAPEMLSPVPGTQFSGTEVTFNWTANDTRVRQWYFRVGSTVGGEEYLAARITDGKADTFTVTGLPNDGSRIHVEFSHRLPQGIWVSENLEYDAFELILENEPPVAVDDSGYSVIAGESLSVDVLANDSDADGSLIAESVSIVTAPQSGTAGVESDGRITYKNDGNSEAQTDSLTYTVRDNDGATSNVATVSLSIERVIENESPLAADDAGRVSSGETVSINVLANDSDSDGELVAGSVSIVTAPQGGTAAVESDGRITYTHDSSSEADTDSLSYTVRDNDGATSNTAIVSISIERVIENVPPLAANDNGGLVSDGGSVNVDVLGNDTDEDGNLITGSVTIVTAPQAGTAAVESDGTITYTHDGVSTLESDALEYAVRDDDGALSNSATVSFTIVLSRNRDIPAEVADAARLLMQGSFGPTDAAIDEVIDLGGPAAWIDAQLELPVTRHLPLVNQQFPLSGEPGIQQGRYRAFWDRAIRADDQLRQRVAFSLSHIFVVSDKASPLREHGNGLAAYYDVLLEHSFGNFRDLMESVTLNPTMGVYLSMLGNRKPNPTTGRRADENYARELMQLFSIGLVELNIDGTEREGTTTYTQEDVENLARAFTGWAWDLDSFRGWNSGWKPDRGAWERPMVGFEEHHDKDVKVVLGQTIPAGQTAAQDMTRAMDIIFAHPNVGPFISKQLIQRLVTSNPTPAYVARVARVFNDNGSGVRGDLASVIRAILLDNEARSETIASQPDFGKLRESLLRYTHAFRAFNVTDPIQFPIWRGRSVPVAAPLTAPSVFNFFRPTYSPPGTFTMQQIVAPEFQLNSETNINDVNKALMKFVIDEEVLGADVRVDLDAAQALMSDTPALLTYLNKILLAGRMTDDIRDLLTRYMEENSEGVDSDRLLRDVIGLLVTSTEFAVQR